MSKSKWSRADTEATVLLKLDDHMNIIRYHTTRKCSQYIYLALQLCDATLEQVVENPQNYPTVDGFNIFKQALEGLAHLHGLNPSIVHRDVKPSNVLVYFPTGNYPPRGMISDLGLSKQLESLRHSFSNSVRGTRGWVAPEILRMINKPKTYGNVRITLKCDIFNAGMLFYYVCSNGKHAFGEGIVEKEGNILHGEYFLNGIERQFKLFSGVIESMIQFQPENRPTAYEVISQLKAGGEF